MFDRTIGLVKRDFAVLGTPAVPVYLLKSRSGWILVDAGVAPLAPLVLDQIDAIVKDRRAIVAWIVTHSHYDHCGLLPYVVPLLPNVRVFASHAAAAAFGRSTVQRVIERLNGELFEQATAPALHRVAYGDLAITRVAGGDRLDFGGGCAFEVMATPGHCDCQIALFQPSCGRVFVADALGDLSEPPVWCPLAFDDVAAYRRSIRTISELDAGEICLAHHYRLTGDSARRAPGDALEALDRFVEAAASIRAEDPSADVAASLSRRYRGATAAFVPDDLHVRSMQRMLALLAPDVREESSDRVR